MASIVDGMTRLGNVLAWGLALSGGALAAQGPGPALPEGAILRFHVRDGTVESGRLVAPFARDSTTFRYCTYPAPPCTAGGTRYRERAAAEVAAVDRFVGSRSRAGAFTGGLIGLLAGVYFGAVLSSVSETEVPVGTTVAVALIPAVVLGTVGAMIGSANQTWRRIDGVPRD